MPASKPSSKAGSRASSSKTAKSGSASDTPRPPGTAASATSTATQPLPLVPITVRVKHRRTTYMLDAMLGGQVPAKVLSLKQALLNAVNPARKVGHVVRRAHDGFEQRMPHSVTGIRLLKPAALALAGKAGSTALAKGGPAAGKLAAGTTAVPGKDQIMTSATGAPHGTAYASNVQVLDDELTLDQAGLVQDHILLAVFEGISRTLGM